MTNEQPPSDREKARLYHKQWRDRNRESYRKAAREYRKYWCEVNPEKAKEAHRRHYRNNAAKLRARAKEYQRKRTDWFRDIKRRTGCKGCGETDPVVLDFHHTDPSTKLFNVGHRAGHVTREVLLAEVAKCQLLCCRCHRKHHYARDRDHVYDLLTLAEIEEVSRKAREAFEQYSRANDAGARPRAGPMSRTEPAGRRVRPR